MLHKIKKNEDFKVKIIKRAIAADLKKAATYFPVVAVLGPRQSGKTTLVQDIFNKHTYISLEDIDNRTLANKDPRRFLQDYPNEHGIILDEVQHAPDLLSYIQTIVDKEKKRGYFIIIGSNPAYAYPGHRARQASADFGQGPRNQLNETITQTLAGRVALLTLLPLSIEELKNADLLPNKIEEAVFNGGYPRIYSDNIPADKLYPNYIDTYIERDVRQIKNITDLHTFKIFVQLCAGSTGRSLNLTSLGNDCGIDQKTAKAWLSILEATYIVFLLYPYHKHFGKRIVKTPKLYFIDTGIACSLLRIKSAQEIQEHYLRGGLVESFMIAELYKQYYNIDQRPALYFWCDHGGREIDVIVDQALKATPVEIKSGKTVGLDYFDQLAYWSATTKSTTEKFVFYGGDTDHSWPEAKVLSWKSIGGFIKKLEKVED